VVGGFDFTESKFNRSLQGWRQAGSTLKPFLYAAAIERGFLTPASILDDTPVQLDTASGLYVPQNYDRAFKGPVSVRTALAGSLNVPAVRTLLLEGVESFRDRLSRRRLSRADRGRRLLRLLPRARFGRSDFARARPTPIACSRMAAAGRASVSP